MIKSLNKFYLDVVPQHLAMSLGTSLAQAFATFASSSHGQNQVSVTGFESNDYCCNFIDILSTLIFVCFKSSPQNAMRSPPTLAPHRIALALRTRKVINKIS